MYDPLDGLSPFFDQPFGCIATGATGYNVVETDEEDRIDINETLASYVGSSSCDPLGIIDNVDSGYNSCVDLFSNSSIVDCSDSTSELYQFRLGLEQPGAGDCYSATTATSSPSSCTYSDINNNNIINRINNINCINNDDNTTTTTSTSLASNNINSGTNNLNSLNNDNSDSYIYSYNSISNFSNHIDNNLGCIQYYDCYKSSNGDRNSPAGEQTRKTPSATKRSVLMNLLIDGSDIGAGYTLGRNVNINSVAISQ